MEKIDKEAWTNNNIESDEQTTILIDKVNEIVERVNEIESYIDEVIDDLKIRIRDIDQYEEPVSIVKMGPKDRDGLNKMWHVLHMLSINYYHTALEVASPWE